MISTLKRLGQEARMIPLALLMSFLMASHVFSQTRPTNYDEGLVPKFTLDHVLNGPDGQRIESAEQWPGHRTYLLELLAQHEYGIAPSDSVEVDVSLVDDGIYTDGINETPTIRRRQYVVTLSRQGKSLPIVVLLWSPMGATKSACFLGLNFRGNQSTTDDPNVRLTESWCDASNPGVVDHRATEDSRASQDERWPVKEIVGAGYSVATAHYSDIDPDFDDGFENGVHALYPEFRCTVEHPERWGSIAAWAWGLSRIVDALQSVEGIDQERWMVIGHSRLGKTALWAGAQDPRFRLVISNNSGCGGAALSHRCYGESVATINRAFPHWFNRNFRTYNDAEESMPFDQHQLIAAIAPRLVYIASATEDRWADPQGELLAGHLASPAQQLFGRRGLEATELPPVQQSIGDSIGYHLRKGKHDLTPFDWQQFVQFAKRNGL